MKIIVTAAILGCAILSTPLRAQTMRFENSPTIEGLVFSGLAAEVIRTGPQSTLLGFMCVASPDNPNLAKKYDITFTFLRGGEAIGQARNVDLMTNYGFSARCDGTIPFKDGNKLPDKIKIEVAVTNSLAYAALGPSPQNDGNFGAVEINGLSFSGLKAAVTPQEKDKKSYSFDCLVTVPKNEIRRLKTIAFFLSGTEGPPFVWRETTGMPLVVRNGETKNCGTASGPVPDVGSDVSRLRIQVEESLPDRHSITVVERRSAGK